MTLKQRVLTFVDANPGYTHRGLADTLGAPIASIRRTTQELHNVGNLLKRTSENGAVEFYPVGSAQAYDTTPATV